MTLRNHSCGPLRLCTETGRSLDEFLPQNDIPPKLSVRRRPYYKHSFQEKFSLYNSTVIYCSLAALVSSTTVRKKWALSSSICARSQYFSKPKSINIRTEIMLSGALLEAFVLPAPIAKTFRSAWNYREGVCCNFY